MLDSLSVRANFVNVLLCGADLCAGDVQRHEHLFARPLPLPPLDRLLRRPPPRNGGEEKAGSDRAPAAESLLCGAGNLAGVDSLHHAFSKSVRSGLPCEGAFEIVFEGVHQWSPSFLRSATSARCR